MYGAHFLGSGAKLLGNRTNTSLSSRKSFDSACHRRRRMHRPLRKLGIAFSSVSPGTRFAFFMPRNALDYEIVTL